VNRVPAGVTFLMVDMTNVLVGLESSQDSATDKHEWSQKCAPVEHTISTLNA
jgi:hypothetical protein